MRLLDTAQLNFHEFEGEHIPPYAILSHTWEYGEVSHQDMRTGAGHAKAGYQKIQHCAELAAEAGLEYFWVDTCAIDRTSSAELTEAINSMFQWYQDSAICIVWLADLDADPPEPDFALNLRRCRWFTRGWTLQELIAPAKVVFYDQNWNLRGNKTELSSLLAEITGIDIQVLQDVSCLHDFPVAQKLSWASSRQTTRLEDTAYCLLGVVNVNMPLIYGEGKRAFVRLQEEIARVSNDLSLFAWRALKSEQAFCGILATSPSEFSGSGNVQLMQDPAFNPEFQLTNKGLRIKMNLYYGDEGVYLLNLNCAQPTLEGSKKQIGIWLQARGGGVYSRIKAYEFGVVDPARVITPIDNTRMPTLYITKQISLAAVATLEAVHRDAFLFRRGFNQAKMPLNDADAPFHATHIAPTEAWDAQRRMFLYYGTSSFTACVFMYSRERRVMQSFVVAFGKTAPAAEPWLTVEGQSTVEGGPPGVGLMRYMRDLNKLAELGPGCPSREGLILSGIKTDPMRVRVSLEKAVVDGESVYCIDIDYETDPKLKGQHVVRFW